MRLRAISTTTVGAAVLLLSSSGPAAAQPGPASTGQQCTSGARTLSHFGDHVYPETGNGGYRSLHTDVHLVYDATSNLFLVGNHVDLTEQATQCLSDFSLDFQRTSAAGVDSPDLAVASVTVNGRPAAYRFVQPT
jgi:hypothetical protein